MQTNDVSTGEGDHSQLLKVLSIFLFLLRIYVGICISMWSWVYVWETVACMYAELCACLRRWVHIWETVNCVYAEVGVCLVNGCLHVCGIVCMSAEIV